MDIKTPTLPVPKINIDKRKEKRIKYKKQKEKTKKSVKYLDLLYDKSFIDKYFNEK